jgi:hypothetical protein
VVGTEQNQICLLEGFKGCFYHRSLVHRPRLCSFCPYVRGTVEILTILDPIVSFHLRVNGVVLKWAQWAPVVAYEELLEYNPVSRLKVRY